MKIGTRLFRAIRRLPPPIITPEQAEQIALEDYMNRSSIKPRYVETTLCDRYYRVIVIHHNVFQAPVYILDAYTGELLDFGGPGIR